MTDKQKKEELKQVVTNLGNIEFSVEDELKFCKEVLKRKEQECEKLNNTITNLENTKEELLTKIDQLKVENKEYKDIINKLAGKTIAITSGDKPFEFCDHKDLTIKQLKLDKETYKYQLENQYELCEYWQGQAEKYKQVLQEIKEVIKQEGYINKKTQIVKGSILYQAMEDLKLPDKKILKIIERVLDV